MLSNKIDLVLQFMAEEIETNRAEILSVNAEDVANCDKADVALYDRLAVNDAKIDGMIKSLHQVKEKASPLNHSLYSFTHENGIEIENKTVPFGTILIIYESRPDVTVEATAIALKSGNKILLKGGKEARKSNLLLSKCWEKALERAEAEKNTVRFLDLNRQDFQDYLKKPDTPIDLIIPRGGQRLIEYVYSVATCPVLVSGRGNNFMYISENADLEMAKDLIIQSKISKISACNALDKVLINKKIANSFKTDIIASLEAEMVEVLENIDEATWYEEFLDKKIVIAEVDTLEMAVSMINKYSGQHSATIVSSIENEADLFMNEVDCAAVYHNVSTRFTDGFQFGLGAEMAISTQKVHHRGPLGIEHLVTNKWYVKGNGQTR